MSTNEKTANEVIEELEAENARLRELNEELQATLKKLYGYAAELQKLYGYAAELLDELMNYCAECNGDGTERCPYYNKDGDMCRMAQDGTCDTWMTICKATGHDPATPWEVEK